MIKILLMCFIFSLAACDMIMGSSSKKIPDNFEIEDFIYTHGRFPDCYSSVSKITNKSAAAFAKNMNDFRDSKHLEGQYEEWKPTPVPPEFLDEERLESIGTLNTVESGISCYETSPNKIDSYHKIYWSAIESGGGYYSFLEDSDKIFMLYIPGERLLFHTVR